MNCAVQQPCPVHTPEFDDWREKTSATLARIEERQENFRKEMVGNGQPGRVQRLEEIQRSTAERVTALEAAHNQQIGRHSVITIIVALIVSLIVSVATASIVDHLHVPAPHTTKEATR